MTDILASIAIKDADIDTNEVLVMYDSTGINALSTITISANPATLAFQ